MCKMTPRNVGNYIWRCKKKKISSHPNKIKHSLDAYSSRILHYFIYNKPCIGDPVKGRECWYQYHIFMGSGNMWSSEVGYGVGWRSRNWTNFQDIVAFIDNIDVDSLNSINPAHVFYTLQRSIHIWTHKRNQGHEHQNIKTYMHSSRSIINNACIINNCGNWSSSVVAYTYYQQVARELLRSVTPYTDNQCRELPSC